MPVCQVCYQSKDPAEFYANRVNKSGIQQPCRPCKRKGLRMRYATDPVFRAHVKRRVKARLDDNAELLEEAARYVRSHWDGKEG